MPNDPAATDPTSPPAPGGAGPSSAPTKDKKRRKAQKADAADEPGTGELRADGKPKAPKATNAEIAQRVEEVLRLKLDGAQYHDIAQYAAEHGWPTSERQVREYMGRADDLLRERQEKKRSRLLAYHRAVRRSLFARALQAADHRTCLAILDSEAKLIGLFPDGRGTDAKPGSVPLVTITTDDDDHPPATAG